nr:hypothetical protein [Tanacetum cinerariifolium]
DEIIAEGQPYVEDALPTAQSPEYVPESDLEAHPEDDDDEDPEEDPVDYLADGGDDDDDEEGSLKDDEDDDMDIEADEEEEEEHPAPADSIVVGSTTADQAPSVEETEPFETDESAAAPPPHPAYCMTAKISIPAPVPIPAWSNSEIVRLLAIEIIRDPEREVGSRIADSWDEIVETLQGAPVSTDTELGGYIREFEMRVRQDTDEIYMRLDDEQTERQLLAGRLNMLFRDRRAHAYTRHLMETGARMSREAWVRSTDAIDLVRGEVMSLRTTVLGQMTEIRELHAADRRRQTDIYRDYRVEDSPTGTGDDDDDEEGSLEDDEDDDMDIEADKEEEEHLAHADSVVVASTATDQAPSAEETKPFETDEFAATPPP